MKRRSVLEGVSAGLAFGVGRGSAEPGAGTARGPAARSAPGREIPSSREPSDRAGAGPAGAARDREPWYDFSVRSLADRMDPVRPITRVRGGYSRPNEEELKEWIDEAYVSSLRQRVDRIGLYHNDDKGLFEVHRGTDEPSLRDVAERHSDGHHHRLLHLNTWLAASAGSRAERIQRAREIGQFVRAEGFDIVGLNEVYDVNLFANAPWVLYENAGTDRYDRTTGPSQKGFDANSGNQLLVRTGANRRIVDHTAETFENEPRGASSWVQYGINHTEIDLGPGHVDYVVTKLQPDGSGGGDYEPYDETRLAQARDVARYVDRHSPPENVAIVTGDMNVPTRPHHGLTNHDEFLRTMDETADLEDVYLRRGGKAAGTIGIHEEKNCDVRGPAGGNRGRPCYCADYTDVDRAYSAQRLDYVFVERPGTAHDIHLDIPRIRRRAMRRSDRCVQRASADPSKMLLSDHAGLELTLIAS